MYKQTVTLIVTVKYFATSLSEGFLVMVVNKQNNTNPDVQIHQAAIRGTESNQFLTQTPGIISSLSLRPIWLSPYPALAITAVLQGRLIISHTHLNTLSDTY